MPAVLLRQLVSPPPPLRRRRPEIPAQVEEVIFWALAKDPDDRPATAGQFARALRAALESEPLVCGTGRPLEGSSQRALPLWPTKRAAVVVKASPEESSITTSPDGLSMDRVLSQTGGYGRYTPGAPLWPLPQTGPGKRGVLAAVIGLALGLVALIIMAAFLVTTVQPELTRPSGIPSGVVLASPTEDSQHAAVTASPTLTHVPLTPTLLPPTNWLMITPTLVTVACRSRRSCTLQLTNTGPEAISWAAETRSSRHADITITPASGSLGAGATQGISLWLKSGKLERGQNMIVFGVVSDLETGNPAQASYSIAACDGD